MGYFKHCHQVENMLRQALVVLCIALAVQAKTRKGPLPHLFWDQVKHLETVDEPENKIVGGEEVDISERPFQIVFLYYGSLRCGGAWMGGKNILTAAHCCDGVSASSVSVRLGSSKHASGGEVIDVAQVISNPAYDDFDISNDACILVLESEPTNSVAAPVDLPSSAMDIPEGASFVVSGWGNARRNKEGNLYLLAGSTCMLSAIIVAIQLDFIDLAPDPLKWKDVKNIKG